LVVILNEVETCDMYIGKDVRRFFKKLFFLILVGLL